jgi:hypothetical protein
LGVDLIETFAGLKLALCFAPMMEHIGHQ